MTLTYTAAAQDQGKTLFSVLHYRLHISTGQIKRLKYQTQMLVNGVPVHTDFRVTPGDLISLPLPEEHASFPPEPGNLRVLYEDEAIIALHKPAGIIMHPSATRNTEVLEADIRAGDALELLAISPEVGVFAAATPDKRQIFVCGHLEYDADTLSTEYFRDVKKGLDIDVPKHYFPNDDPSQPPIVSWRAHGQLFYSNWLNYYVYQATPYDLRDL
jgi:hypothetical protein